MAAFESRVSEIFDENPHLRRQTRIVIRRMFNMSDVEFRRWLQTLSEQETLDNLMRLHDVLFIDHYFPEIDSRFMDWVIEQYPERFREAELREMRAQADSHIDFYEIQEVFPGKGSRIKSLFTGTEGFLKDISSSYQFTKWDLFTTRCYPMEEYFLATGSVVQYTPDHRKTIQEMVEKEFEIYQKEYPGFDYPSFARIRWELFFKIRRDIEEKVKSRILLTPFGVLQPCEVRFQVLDFQHVIDTINLLDEFDYQKSVERRRKKKKITRYDYNWSTQGIEERLEPIRSKPVENSLIVTTQRMDAKANPAGVQGLGTLSVDPMLLRVETRSMELAEFARDHLLQVLGNAVIFKRIVKLKLEFPEVASNSEAAELPEVPELDEEMIRELQTQFYAKQISEKVPQLNNMTPLEAARNPSMRPTLIEWLKGLENHYERMRGRGPFDFSIDTIKRLLDVDF